MKKILVIIMLGWSLTISAQERPPIYIQTSVDNAAPYVNQPITFTVQAFDSTGTTGLEISYPDFNGFGQQPLDDIITTSEILDGVRYTVYTQRILLFPNLAGIAIVEPAILRVPETPFTEAGDYSSTQLAINVQSLPLNAPLAYTNGVGEFTLAVSVDETAIAPTQDITLTVIVDGQGSITQLQFPSLELSSADWRVIELEPEFTGEFTQGRKTFSWTLLPQREGMLSIPSLELSTFNPLTNAYNTQTLTPISITVGRSSATIAAPTATLVTTTVEPLLLPTRSNVAIIQPTLWQTLTPAIEWWVLPPFGMLVLGLIMRFVRRPATTSIRRKSPFTDLKMPLITLQQKPPAQAFEELHLLILTAVQQRAALQSLSPEQFVSSLLPDTKSKLDDTVNYAAAARYAPATAQDVQAFSQQVYTLFKLIDRQNEKP